MSWAWATSQHRSSYLQGLDESQVVLCDVVVEVLDLPEVLLVVLHERGDEVVLASFHFVEITLPQAVLLQPQHSHLLLIQGLDFCTSSTNRKRMYSFVLEEYKKSDNFKLDANYTS